MKELRYELQKEAERLFPCRIDINDCGMAPKYDITESGRRISSYIREAETWILSKWVYYDGCWYPIGIEVDYEDGKTIEDILGMFNSENGY